MIANHVREIIEEVELEPERVLNRYPHQLSGGERQRVNIARALASNPSVLIADEPITMLDAAQRYNVLHLLLDLKTKRNLTLLLVTHDLASARMVSQRIIVMYRGKMVEMGPTDKVLSSPFHPYVELILKATPKLARNQAPLSDYLVPSLAGKSAFQKGCVYRPRCKYATKICEVEPKLEEKSDSHYAACHNPLST